MVMTAAAELFSGSQRAFTMPFISLSLSLSLSQSLGLLVNGEGQRALAVYTWRVFLGSLVGFHYQLSRMRFRTHGSDKAVIRVIGFGKRILSCCQGYSMRYVDRIFYNKFMVFSFFFLIYIQLERNAHIFNDKFSLHASIIIKVIYIFYRELILTPEAKKAKLENSVVSAKRNLEFLRIQMD